MTLQEFKKKAFGLIEELSPENANLTEDPDIAAKINDVVNQRMFEIVRMKKLPKYAEIEGTAGDLVEFADIESAVGNEVYQLGTVGGVAYEPKADGTVLKIKESGTLEVNCYVYPERITEKTKDTYEFELTPDVLEILVYGVAADLLKSDVSAEYGSIYATEYEKLLNRLDPRYAMTSIYIEGGVL